MQSPLVDKLLGEIGLDPSSLEGLTKPLSVGMKEEDDDADEEEIADSTGSVPASPKVN